MTDPIVRHLLRWRALIREHNLTPETPEGLDRRGQLCDDWTHELRKAASTPATTLEGITAKLQLLQHEIAAGERTDDLDDCLIAGVLEDIDLLAHGTPTPTGDPDREGEDFLALPFVTAASQWSPSGVSNEKVDSGHAYCAEQALGAYYAAELVGHLRRFGPTIADPAEHLAEIIAEMVERRQFGPVERAFITGLAEFIAHGRIKLASGFDATPSEPD